MLVTTERGKAAKLRYDAGASPVSILCGDGNRRCSRPVMLDIMGRPDVVLHIAGREPTAIRQLAAVRCRKCDECLRHRARLWTARAIDETIASTRTWFGTLTLAPDRQTWARYSAMRSLERAVSDVNEDAVFRASVTLIGAEITRYLKRVRKSGSFRYLLVTEKHQSGLPHFHILIHEDQVPIRKRELDRCWRFGFSQFRLVETGNEAACGYVCKYLAKSAETRVRASKDYGQVALMQALTEQVLDATRSASAQARSLIGNPPVGQSTI